MVNAMMINENNEKKARMLNVIYKMNFMRNCIARNWTNPKWGEPNAKKVGCRFYVQYLQFIEEKRKKKKKKKDYFYRHLGKARHTECNLAIFVNCEWFVPNIRCCGSKKFRFFFFFFKNRLYFAVVNHHSKRDWN